MTLGELDYNTVMVDSLNATNPETKAPLLPYQESSIIFMGLFIFAMPIILTNLLVSERITKLFNYALNQKYKKTDVLGRFGVQNDNEN